MDSQQTLKKHVLKAALKKGVENGTLVQVKASYKLSADSKKVTTTKNTKADSKKTTEKKPTEKKAAEKKTTEKKTATKASEKKSVTKKAAEKSTEKKEAPKKKVSTKCHWQYLSETPIQCNCAHSMSLIGPCKTTTTKKSTPKVSLLGFVTLKCLPRLESILTHDYFIL